LTEAKLIQGCYLILLYLGYIDTKVIFFVTYVLRCLLLILLLFVYILVVVCSPDIVETLGEETFEVDLMDEERYASLAVRSVANQSGAWVWEG